MKVLVSTVRNISARIGQSYGANIDVRGTIRKGNNTEESVPLPIKGKKPL